MEMIVPIHHRMYSQWRTCQIQQLWMSSHRMSAHNFTSQAPEAEVAEAHRTPLIIEICAGIALLSKCFKDAGFDHLAIDHSKNRFHPYVSICNVDLTKAHGWEFLNHVVTYYHVVFVHAAPPCGTCSRAREIARPNAPRPLRTELQPLGIDGSTATEQARVDAANAIFAGLADFLIRCHAMSIPWSVENPSRSLLSLIPCIRHLQDETCACFYNYDTCAWGSKRLLSSGRFCPHSQPCVGFRPCVPMTMSTCPLAGPSCQMDQPNGTPQMKLHIPFFCVSKLSVSFKMHLICGHKSKAPQQLILPSTSVAL